MPEMHTHKAEERLSLRSRLADLALVWPWVDDLAAEHAIPEDTHYAINLCLEEALANIIRHGYAGEPNHAITISFTLDGKNGLTFIVQDNAPHFSPCWPMEPQEQQSPINRFEPGGQGLRLMRRFAGTLAHEKLSGGNRLTIGFPVAPPKQ